MKLEVREIVKSYDGKTVLDHISLTVQEGQGLCVMGPSGCGKTTLFRILLGLEKPDEGMIKGVQKSFLSAVFQEDRLMEEFNAVENVWIVCNRKYSRTEIQKELCEILPKESLYQPVRQLSGGMKRRVALVRAMKKESSLVIMDEPFTGLDEETKKIVIRYLKKKLEGKTFLFSTHQEEEARQMGTQIYQMCRKTSCFSYEKC